MPDNSFNPQDPFQGFQKEAQHVDKVPASEIRRLGDRRRTNRRIGIAGVVAGAMAIVVTVAALNMSLLTSERGPDIANPPSATQTTPTATQTSPSTTQTSPTATQTSPTNSPPAATSTGSSPTTPPISRKAITTANLPTGKQIYVETPGDMGEPLLVDGLSTASDERTFFVCDNGLAQQPGIVGSKSAIYSGSGVIKRAHLIEMDSAASATRLADTLRAWNDSCPSRVKGINDAPAVASNEPTTTIGGAKVDFSVQQLPVDNQEAAWNGMLVITSGNRVLLIGDFSLGQDYNAVGPYKHAQDPSLPLVPTARELDSIIQRLNA